MIMQKKKIIPIFYFLLILFCFYITILILQKNSLKKMDKQEKKEKEKETITKAKHKQLKKEKETITKKIPDLFKKEKAMLKKEIENEIKYISNTTGIQKIDNAIYQAMMSVNRHKFVPNDIQTRAYVNRPLPIGYGQTISQPLIVALMTQLCNPQKNHKILEIGTGSGYQAAVLSELVEEVYTIEIIPELAKQAKKKLKDLGFNNIFVSEKDGYEGWSEKAPFDTIIVTAAASHVPPPLIKQLKIGGRIVIPLGNPFQAQNLMVVEKTGNKSKDITTREILPVRFVPFTGKIKK